MTGGRRLMERLLVIPGLCFLEDGIFIRRCPDGSITMRQDLRPRPNPQEPMVLDRLSSDEDSEEDDNSMPELEP